MLLRCLQVVGSIVESLAQGGYFVILHQQQDKKHYSHTNGREGEN